MLQKDVARKQSRNKSRRGPEYKAEELVARRTTDRGEREYLVKWHDYPHDKNTCRMQLADCRQGQGREGES